jgi:Cu2+-containing amine oxidase
MPRKTKASRVVKAVKKAAGAVKPKARTRTPPAPADPTLFGALTAGERADALRVLIEDKRVAQMAKVGRYRVTLIEPIPVKPPEPLAGRRLARVVAYDYSADRCVDACVDLDRSQVTQLRISRAQPMLSREEEAAAISIALDDERVKAQLSLGDAPLVAMHYWSNEDTDLAYSRRSAAVLFGSPASRASLVAVVDLIDNQVTDVVPAARW